MTEHPSNDGLKPVVSASNQSISPSPDTKKPTFSRKDRILSILLLALSYVFITAFNMNYPPRLGFLLIIIAGWSILFWYNGEKLSSLNRTGLVMVCASILLPLSMTIYANDGLYLLNCMAVLALSVWGSMIMTGTGKLNHTRPKFIFGGSIYAACLMFCNVDKPVRAFSVKKGSSALKVFIGVLLSIPVILVVVLLLSSSDDNFSSLVSGIGAYITEDFKLFIARAVFAIFFTFLLYSFFYSLRTKHSIEDIPGTHEKSFKNGDGIIFATMIALLCVIYAVFVFLQFTYLFGVASALGVKYSSYARNGFFELAFVTLINIGVALLTFTFTAPGAKTWKLIKILGTVLLSFTLVILASAAYRMISYVGVFGLTAARFLVLWLELVMLVGIIFTAFKLFNPQKKIFLPMVSAGLILYLALNFCNMDGIIAGYNVDRFISGKTSYIDVTYIADLSPDALPAIKRLKDSEMHLETPANTQDIIVRISEYSKKQAEHFWSWSISYTVNRE